MTGSLQCIAGQIDDHIRTKVRDAGPERCFGFFNSPVRDDTVDLLPGFMTAVGLPLAAADATTLCPAPTSRGDRYVPICPLPPMTTTRMPHYNRCQATPGQTGRSQS